MPLQLQALRPAARACNGMVSAPHALAAQAGVGLLQAGGNAADAAIAVAASLSVLYPHMTGLGGDAFILYYDAAANELIGYNGSGAAAQAATQHFYRERGMSAIPERGGLAAVTVPGAVDAWFALYERFGSLEFAALLQPAIAYAEGGAPVARSLADAWALHHSMLVLDEGGATVFGDARMARTGTLLRQPQLAQTLRMIGQAGRGWFYEGGGASRIDEYCKRIGSPLRADDLRRHRGFFCDPVRSPFFDFESVTMPPNSQGIALLLAQRVLEAFAGPSLPDADSAAFNHAAVESIKFAFADRDAHVGDPALSTAWRRLLSKEHVQERASGIDPFAATPLPAESTAAGDTAYFAVVDKLGNAASYIQSLFHSFGAGVVVADMGVALNNRGSAFSLGRNDVRALAPARRPFHTLMPCMLLQGGKPWLVYGSMGGEGQPQTALMLSTRIAYFGMEAQAAIEAPRWRWGKAWEDEPAALNIETRFPDACIAGLRARGHRMHLVGDWDESMGHAGAIVIAQDGLLQGGADPRGDGAALGY